MISWKYSFEKISKDLELARKKKQALDNLYNSGRISASTYDSIDNELCNIISDIEIRQKNLANALTSKVDDLEQQIGTLEVFLANSEIQYVAGEIDDEIHANESSAFSTGLSSLKTQLAKLKEAVSILIPEEAVSEPIVTEVEAEQVQVPENTVEETTETSSEIIDATPVEIPGTAMVETLVEPASDQTVSESMESTSMENEFPTEPVIEANESAPVTMLNEVPNETLNVQIEAPIDSTFTAPVEVQTQEEVIQTTTEIPFEAVETTEITIEETINPSIAVPTEAPTEISVETPVESTIEENVEETVEKSVEQSVEVMVETPQTVEETIEEIATPSNETYVETPAEEPIDVSIDLPEVPVDASIESPTEVPVEAPSEEFAAQNMDIQNELEVVESPEEKIEIEPVFDDLPLEETPEVTTTEIIEENTEVNTEQAVEIPTTEEITEVETLQESPIEEVTVEEVTKEEIIQETQSDEIEINDEELTEEVVEEEVADDDDELTIEDNSENY